METVYSRIYLFEEKFYKHIDYKILKYSFLSTFIFSLLANGFAYFNLIPQHDSINHTFEFAGTWEISLGRFLLPLYGEIQGFTIIPWIIGVLSIIFISITVYSVCIILNFNSKWQIIVVASVLSANVSITEQISTFTWLSAVYMLAVAMACMALLILLNNTSVKFCILSAVLFTFSLGLYQAEIIFVICLICVTAINDFLDNVEFKSLFRKYIRIIAVLFCSLILYYVLYKIMLNVYEIASRNSYNSLSRLKDITLSSIISSVKACYISFFKFFFGKECVIGACSQICNIILLIISLGFVIRHIIKNKLHIYNVIFVFAVLVIFPCITCSIDIILLNDNLSFYILYSLFTVYLLFLSIINKCSYTIDKKHIAELTKRLIILCFSVILFQNVIFSNQFYSYQKIMYDRTVSIMTRILDDVESDPEYEIGETEVIIIGSLNNNKYIKKVLKINDNLPSTLQKNMNLREFGNNFMLSGGKYLSVTYSMTFDSFAYLLGSEINYTSGSDLNKQYAKLEKIINMPIYPKEGYCQIIDGRMVIKLS